ncbi:MAG: PorT family protein [Chitinophagales bacterium]|nr:PorT family protein [Chitinophagales bacterium]
MKKLITLSLAIFAAVQLIAQVQFNPQIGITTLSLKNPPSGVTFDGKIGMNLGADLRFGERFQIQPGVHHINSITAFQSTDAEVETGEVVYKSLKIKALAAFNLIDAGQLKLRINAGPSYDFLLSAKEKESKINVKEDYKNGTFFLQGGVGVDFLFLTADLGYAHGLSQTFAGEGAPDSKMAGMYFTVGIIFGKGKK